MTEAKGQVYFEVPSGFNSNLEVATCYIRYESELLFLKRLPHKAQGGLWGIPGGKVDKESRPIETMIREIKEETSIDLYGQSIQPFGTAYVRYPEVDFIYHMFGCALERLPEIILNPDEHIQYAWWSFKEAFSHPVILFEDACSFIVWNDPFFDGIEKPVLKVLTVESLV